MMPVMPEAAYVFKKRRYQILMRTIDALGGAASRLRRKITADDPRRILVVRVDSIGDVINTFPLVASLRDKYPEASIGLITSAAGELILRGAPQPDWIRTLEVPWFREIRRGGLRRPWLALRRLVREFGPDWILEPRGDFRLITAARAGAPRARISGYGITGGGFLLDDCRRYERKRHAIQHNLEFAGEGGGAPEAGWGRSLGNEPLDVRIRETLSKAEGLKIALHAGAGRRSKLWPETHWRELIKRLSRQHPCSFFWIGDTEAKRVTGRIRSGLRAGSTTDCCGAVPLSQLGTFLESCDLFISTDSGPAHLAAAHGVPEIVIFSRANAPREWAPWNPNARVLSHEVPCADCGLGSCPMARHACMEQLEPSEVAQAAGELRVMNENRRLRCKTS